MLDIALLTVLFVGMSGLMALVEASLLSISRGEVEELRSRGVSGAKALQAVTTKLTRAIVVVVICTNLVNVLGPILVARQAIQLYGDSAIVPITVTLTLATIVFSEIIPKSLGSHYAPQIAPIAAPPIRALVAILFPLTVTLEWLSSLLKSGQRRIGTEAQIRSLVTIGRRAGFIEEDEGQMIRRAFVLNDKTAADIMTRLDEVIALKGSANLRQAATQIFHHAYSRYPVYGKSIHDVTGLAMSRDILEALAAGRDKEPVSGISKPALIVPGDIRSDELLVQFRDRHIHLAVVQDGNRTVGVVTLEDVLEELVGEIEDEKDTES